nr:PPK2_P_aer: polyphosphate kinase [uncultured bacterium]
MPKGLPNTNQLLSRIEVQRLEMICDLHEKEHPIESILEIVYFIIPKSRERFQDPEWYVSFAEGKPSAQEVNTFRRIWYTKYVKSLIRSLER